jgi:hypothetical protein
MHYTHPMPRNLARLLTKEHTMNKQIVPLYFRKKNLIITAKEGKPAGGEVEHCKSVNAAKRKSADLQRANGGMGNGSVRVLR